MCAGGAALERKEVNILPQDKWDLMVFLICQGETHREVARRAGVDRDTVRLAAHAMGERRTRSDGMRRYHERRRAEMSGRTKPEGSQ